MYPIKTKKLRITSKYGNRTITVNGKTTTGFHRGIDITADPNNRNEDIVAFADGVVDSLVRVGRQYGTACYVRLKHSNGKHTLYYHLKSNSIVVKVGETVKQGAKLGVIGTTGNSTGVHLHFQIDKGSSATSEDPYPYLFEGKEFISKSKLKSNEEIADEVIAGKWGNQPDRQKALEKAGYNYEAVRKIVNKKLGTKPAPTVSFKKGDKVYPIKPVDYNGRPLKVWDRSYTITEITGKRAVLSARRGLRLVVWAAVNTDNLRRV